MKPRLVLGALALIGSLGAGCTSPARLDLAPSARTSGLTPPGAAVVSTQSCTVCWQPLQDRRKDSASLGRVGARSVSAEQSAGWIEQELLGLASPLFRVTAPSDTGAALTVAPVLHKLYVDNLSTTKTAVVVLELTFTPRGGAASRRVYRGQHASMNWWSNEEEITSAVKLAVADCLTKVRVDLEARARLAGNG